MKALILTGLVIALSGCSSSKPTGGESYTARGKITALPEGARSNEVEIHHESIPTFRNQQGTVSGMHSMPMPFAPAAGVSLAGFNVGDKVTFTFEVVWDDRSPLHLTRLEKLPADTALTLE